MGDFSYVGRLSKTELAECLDCRKDSGSDRLCPACLHNRSVVGEFNNAVDFTRKELRSAIIRHHSTRKADIATRDNLIALLAITGAALFAAMMLIFRMMLGG